MTDTTRVPLLRIRRLTKSFPGLRALDSVSLDVFSGEVVGLVGHNGSGKSTLVKVLAGVYTPDPGAVLEVRDDHAQLSALQPSRSDLHFIHQNLGLVELLSTIENLDLGRLGTRCALLPSHRARETSAAQALLERFGVDLDVSVPIGQLSAAERTMVAIVRALSAWRRPDSVLVLDETTAALHADEARRLFDVVRRVASEGAGILFISHRLEEVLGIADRVVVLRDGHVVADEQSDNVRHADLVRLIAGDVAAQVPTGSSARTWEEPTEPALIADCVSGGTVKSLSLAVRPGEILGVAGLLGSGREDVASLLFGAHSRTAGDVRAHGQVLPNHNPSAAIEAGVGCVMADRARSGAILSMTVRENLTLADLRPVTKLGRLSRRLEMEDVLNWGRQVQLRPLRPDQPLELFSGGNQQKTVIAKWLRVASNVLILDEPTQGVDVAAQASIHDLVHQAAGNGVGVIVCSSDNKELAAVCDTVLVMRDGEVAAEVATDRLSELTLVHESLGLDDDGNDKTGITPLGHAGERDA